MIAKYRPQLSDEKADPAIVEKLRAECAQLVSAISEKRKAAMIDYIKAHPSSDVSVALVTDMGLNSIEEGVKLLTDAARQSSIAPLYKNVLEEIKAYREKKAKGMAMEGKPAPSFTLNDINGKPLKLESLRGKYVVLDFWGSWCGWCIKGIPEMKKYYDKYKDKMEILGIDCNDTEAKWKAAVAKHELAWKHVRNAGQTDVTKLYYIQGYPTKIIVAPDGVVKKVAVGEDPEFYKYLDSLFK
nr:TlpA disulfide reductase family protein [uncultured Prevotella sp.]